MEVRFQMSGQTAEPVSFRCNGRDVTVGAEPGESLLSVLRERLGVVSVKDGCAPQGQCGCCTVLVDGAARVACVTPVARVAGRDVVTVEGLDLDVRDRLATAFVETGGSQCGFCTPGILVRAAALLAKGIPGRPEVDRALAAHLCRCTGWNTVREAVDAAAAPSRTVPRARDLDAASRRAELEGGVAQRVGAGVPLGHGGFADDEAPRDALVAVPAPPGTTAPTVEAGGLAWVVAESLLEARARAGKVQGRRTTVDASAPMPLPDLPPGGVRLATSWVEPAYLEPDASWCEPGGVPATPLANGGAFGGKLASPAPAAARELADRYGRSVRTVFSREDCVRLGPKRPPVAGTAVWDGTAVVCILGWDRDRPGPAVSDGLRAFPLAERAVLFAGALAEAGVDRNACLLDERSHGVLLDTVVQTESHAVAGARVVVDPTSGELERVEVRVAAGDPLDAVVLRSYCVGAVHMALGWVLTEGLAVDPDSGEPLDLTIRSFGVIRAKDTPPIDVTIVDDEGPPLARASDAVFAAVAAATWNAVTEAEGVRPETFPALGTRASRRLRR